MKPNSDPVLASVRHRRRTRAARCWAWAFVASLAWLTIDAGSVAHGASGLTLGTASAGPGETAEIAVQFQTDSPVAALQFDVQFDGNRLTPGFAAGSTPVAGFVVASSVPSPGVARVLIYSLMNTPLPSGLVASLPMRVVSPAAAGTVPLTLARAILASPAGAPIQPVSAVPGAVTIRDSVSFAFDLPAVAANGQVTLRLNGQDGRAYTIQASANLETWQDLATGVTAGGVLNYLDASATGQSRRFYRAVEAP